MRSGSRGLHFSHIGVRKCLIAHDSVILCENGTEYGANMRIHVRYLFLTSIVILEERVHTICDMIESNIGIQTTPCFGFCLFWL